MKKVFVTLAALFVLAGCASEEQQLENAVREGLTNQGAVQEVDLTVSDENNLTGYAVVRGTSGDRRLNCSAQRREGSNFNWRCAPTIDEVTLQEVETAIRTNLASQAEVVSVDMQRGADDDHMSGQAVVRDPVGGEVRVPCTGERAPDGSFNWRCGEEQAAGAGGK